MARQRRDGRGWGGEKREEEEKKGEKDRIGQPDNHPVTQPATEEAEK